MTQYILSIDPGKTTGWALAKYDADTLYTIIKVGTTHDGLNGFLEWWWDHTDYYEGYGNFRDNMWSQFGEYPNYEDKLAIVLEEFQLRGNNPFVPDLSGKEIIGYLKGTASDLVLQYRTDKALVPDRVLKENGLWYTGKQVGHIDGRDVNDAIIHGLVYARRQNHEPTIRAYFLEDENE